MAITVRTAEKDDAKALGRMGSALARLHHEFDAARFMLPEGMEAGYEWWLAKEMENPKAIVLVAVGEDDRPVGYCYGRIEGRDWNKLLDSHGELVDIWVDDRARKTGAGGLLIDEMMKRFEENGVERAVLSSAWPNETAQRLFRTKGFRPTMVEMTRDLTPARAQTKPKAKPKNAKNPKKS